jgi:hypothetical protein
MVDGYLKFFGLRPDGIAEYVLESLKKDVLLLRFFCEAYGSRGKPPGYQQPVIANIYRDQIFHIYLKEKLGTADAFLQRITGEINPVNPKADLMAVLAHVLGHMLGAWSFADVPAATVPSSLHRALYALLDEELILRRDAAQEEAVFSEPKETINFTFDEFRDFLLAQYLLRRVYETDRQAFERYVANSDPKRSQTIEGVKKFLFYASRRQENESFWAYYREKTWYTDVYDAEIFNMIRNRRGQKIRQSPFRRCSRRRARRSFALRLAVSWDGRRSPRLNLDLLLDVVTGSRRSSVRELDSGNVQDIALRK